MVSYADVSHHQGTIDWAAYRNAGHDRVMIKATGGASGGELRYVDPMFAANWRGAAAVGLRRGAYHYARNGNAGSDEWAWFWSQLQAVGGLEPGDWLCYDQEDTLPGGQALARQRTIEFTNAAVAAGRPVGEVYSGKWYLDPAGIRPMDVPAGWRKLWASDYTGGQADAAIELPAGWDRTLIVARQYTDQATVAGIASPCDCSRVLIDWVTGIEEDGMSAEDVSAIRADIKAMHDDVALRLQRIDNLDHTIHDVTLTNIGSNVSAAQRALTAQAAAVAAVAAQVSAQADDEVKLAAALAQVRADIASSRADLAAAIAAVQGGGNPPTDPGAYADKVLDELTARLTRGDLPPAA